ncbi:MAG: hypothetical protein OXT73_00065, partial [Bacteroidota bacterium]|nr:hypothetical protein [Bacteroidota bacterium]
DYVFLYGSGSFPLRAGETKRFSIALLVGENLADLRLNAETVQQIFDVGYRFARPPEKPALRAVAGDNKVTLYWDDVAEASRDPLSRENDFEGYAIYRSTDHEFSDQQVITDVNGSKFLFQPLRNEVGVEAKFDLENGLFGPSPIPFQNRGVSFDLGDDTGLFHTYEDTDVINGQTYYYAVTAYDRGYAPGGESDFANGIPPSETAKMVTYNPVTDSYIFDTNTVSIIPRPRVAGYVAPSIEATGGIQRDSGFGTGSIDVRIIDEMAVKPGARYSIDFEDTLSGTRYSVEDLDTITTRIRAVVGKTSALGYQNINPESFVLARGDGSVLDEGVDYVLVPQSGNVQVIGTNVADGDSLTAMFRYRPIADSRLMDGEEANPIFDGMHLFVHDDVLELDEEGTGWSSGGNDIPVTVETARAGPGRTRQPYDYEITFANDIVSTGFSNNLPLPFQVVNVTNGNQPIDVFVTDLDRDGEWDVDETIIFLDIVNDRLTASWQVTLDDIGTTPGSGDILYIQTHKPFSASDRFEFATAAAATDADLARQELRDIYVVPNPYVATNELEPRNPVSRSERGDRRLYFANVPAYCTIRIYSLSGELVDTIVHDSTLDDGKAFWDLRTKDNMNIAYGLYIYHVESEEGTFIGKFAVIK